MPQKSPKRSPRPPKETQEGPKMPQKSPKRTPIPPKRAPWLQEGLRRSKIASKIAQHFLPPPLLARSVSLYAPLLSISRQLSWAGLLNGLVEILFTYGHMAMQCRRPVTRGSELATQPSRARRAQGRRGAGRPGGPQRSGATPPRPPADGRPGGQQATRPAAHPGRPRQGRPGGPQTRHWGWVPVRGDLTGSVPACS